MAHLPAKHHIIISGTCRAGTTFLVQLFTALGVDTGFQDTATGIFPNCNGGMEFDLRDPNAPYLVKDAWICEYLDSLLEGKKYVIDHAIIPVRDLFSAAESRRDVQRRTPNSEQYRHPGDLPGGLWGTTDPAAQELVLQARFYQLMCALAKWNVPTTMLSFPRFIREPEYLHAQLSSVLKNVPYAKFHEAFVKVVRPDLVHQFDPQNGHPAKPLSEQLGQQILRPYEVALRQELNVKEYDNRKLTRDLNASKSEVIELGRSISALNDKITEQARIIRSAEQWQSRSWLKRAFHRWRPSNNNQQKVGFMRRLERSIRKRRKWVVQAIKQK